MFEIIVQCSHCKRRDLFKVENNYYAFNTSMYQYVTEQLPDDKRYHKLRSGENTDKMLCPECKNKFDILERENRKKKDDFMSGKEVKPQ